MDNLTHSLVGALIGQAGLKRKTGLAMPALIIGANLPDIDATCVLLLGPMEHLAVRRGITHGPIAWVMLPFLLAGMLWWFDRWQEKRGKRPEGRLPVHFGWLYALAFVACLTHPALDWLNNYGIRLLEPFSHRWFYGDTLFIIDVWLWLGLGFATWLSLRREKKTGGNWRRPARIALMGATAYIGLNWLITGVSTVSYWHGAGGTIIANPRPIVFWKRQLIATGFDPGFKKPNQWASVPYLINENRPLVDPRRRCKMLNIDALREARPDLDAFLFWSRAPFAERTPDGSVIIRDGRFYDPWTRDRFSVALPQVRCVDPESG